MHIYNLLDVPIRDELLPWFPVVVPSDQELCAVGGGLLDVQQSLLLIDSCLIIDFVHAPEQSLSSTVGSLALEGFCSMQVVHP